MNLVCGVSLVVLKKKKFFLLRFVQFKIETMFIALKEAM